jgi:LacI family transcriptional regulator
LLWGQAKTQAAVSEPSRQPTIEDVADKAGVTPGVVSRVINDGPQPVAPEIRSQVLAAIEELGYRTNPLTVGLKPRQSGSIGLIAPTLTYPVFAEMALGLNDVLVPDDYSILLCETEDDAEKTSRFAAALLAKRVDGVVVVPTAEPDQLVSMFSTGQTPLVIIENQTRGAPAIVIDEIAGGRLAADHLLELGHTRIGAIRGARMARASFRRFDGYVAACADRGVDVDSSLVHELADHHDLRKAEQAAFALLDCSDPPTAIISHNDLIAIIVVSVAARLGMRIPDDISVVGYDDIALAEFSNPPLTTIRVERRELGRLAGTILKAQMAQERPPTVTTLTPRLVERESTGPPR